MGNSTSRSNDLLIDQLVRRERVLVRNVERAFRLVDRAHFLPESLKREAYSDLPIRSKNDNDPTFEPGPLHLSTTDVYITAIGELQIQKGHSFLNIGSGSGYLSTIAGFLVGDTGINDGIEVYPNLVEYSEKRIEEWTRTPEANCVGWTRPRLMVANVLDTEFLELHSHQYDRIYLGFVLDRHEAFSRVLRMLKVGGVLVAPSQSHLCRYTRIGENVTDVEMLSRMRFARAVDPKIEPPAQKPCFDRIHTLTHLSRQAVRREIRQKTFDVTTMRKVSKAVMLTRNGEQNKRILYTRLANQDYMSMRLMVERLARLPEHLPHFGRVTADDTQTDDSTTSDDEADNEEEEEEDEGQESEESEREEEMVAVRITLDERIREAAFDQLAADDHLFMRVANCVQSNFDENVSGNLTGDELNYSYSEDEEDEDDENSETNARSSSSSSDGEEQQPTSSNGSAQKKMKKRVRNRRNLVPDGEKRKKVEKPTAEEMVIFARHKKEEASTKHRGARDEALSKAHKLFESRVRSLPIPKNLKNYVESGKYQVD